MEKLNVCTGGTCCYGVLARNVIKSKNPTTCLYSNCMHILRGMLCAIVHHQRTESRSLLKGLNEVYKNNLLAVKLKKGFWE